jgi:hypothetical protein
MATSIPTPYERRKEYFKRYYLEHKGDFLSRNRKSRLKRARRESVLEEVAKTFSKEDLAEMERKMVARLRGDVKSGGAGVVKP